MLSLNYLLYIDPQYQIGITDLTLLPFFIALVIGVGRKFRDKNYPKGHPYHKYFMPALIIKIVGAVAISIIYIYYYKGGDTLNYFFHARVINSALDESFYKWWQLILGIPSKLDGDFFDYISLMEFYGGGSTYILASVTAFFCLFTYNTLLPTAIIFAGISFIGIWSLFTTFAKLYPKLLIPISTATLFVPSVTLWGSGIFKDTIIILSLGFLTKNIFKLLNQNDFSIRISIEAIIAAIITFYIKPYVVISFAPPALIWALLERTKKINNKQFRIFFTLLSIVLVFSIVGVGITKFQELNPKYSIDGLSATSQVTRNWIAYMTSLDAGSGYDLGEFNPTISGMLSKFPQAVNVTLFRPYLWEAKKIFVFLSGIESLILLLLTFKVIRKVGIGSLVNSILTDSTIQFCILFSLFFAFAVGISSYNFGALSRYKIPCIPFYIIGITLIYYKNINRDERLSKILRL